jgi:hypothetical protein
MTVAAYVTADYQIQPHMHVRALMTQVQTVIRVNSDEALGNACVMCGYSMECQRRGMPHAHMILIMAAEPTPSAHFQVVD